MSNVYLAGPMTGLSDLNRPAFTEAATKLRLEGHDVFNPAAANLDKLPLKQILKYEFNWIFDNADTIALLKGWQSSRGASAEYMLAVALGLKIIFLE